MLQANRAARSPDWQIWRDRLSIGLVVGLQAVALIAFVLIPILALNWMRAPFLGAFVEHTLLFNGVALTEPGRVQLLDTGVRAGDQLVSVDGEEIRSAARLNDLLQGQRAGERLTIGVRTIGGDVRTYEATLAEFGGLNQITFFYVPFFLGLVYLGSGMWVLGLRRQNSAGRAFAVFATATALSLAALFDVYTTHRLTLVWTLSLGLAGGALFHMALVFPDEVPLVRRHRLVGWAGYLPALALGVLAAASLFDFSQPTAYITYWRLEYAFIGLGALFFLGWMTYRRFTSPSPISRAQARIILWGAIVSFGPIAIWFLMLLLRPSITYNPYLLLPLGIFPLATAYAILRYRLLNTDYVFSRAVLYALLTILTAAAYALLVTGLSLLVGVPLATTNPFVVGLAVVIVALLLNPVRNRLQKAVDNVFFRGQEAYRERQSAFGRRLTKAVEIPDIIQTLRQTIDEALLPEQLHIYVHDPLSDQYAAASTDGGRPTSDLRFPANSALAQTLTRRQSSLFLGQAVTLPRALHEDWARMSLLGAQFFVPMPGQHQLVGWIALGNRRSGEPYSDRDLAFLESLGDQAALAIERAQVVDDLERRVHQMNVLTRVAQGVNITSAFDDILELLYAQTNQVLPTEDFFITLYDETSQGVFHAFYLEANDRLSDRENKPLAEREGMAGEVIRTGRAILTDDYNRECRKRAIIPAIQGVYAWMSVPLNTSDDTIGALSLGSRDPAVIYTDDQRDVLQAIADQAAGAIAKARLLQETERRARQLATLNTVAQSLSSTLDLDTLLGRILDSAVEILNCEAGSLFMIDPESGEIVFEVANGPVGSDLVGMRLPPGTGLVGKAVESGEPIIANDVLQTKEWSGETDEQTGFVTRALLVVPLQVKDNIIGVIEVLNKRDGSPFTVEEQELLTVFTGQAAVAIENARLYTLTDQALAARVEELSVMQRIDRELNASLDMARTMGITLDWALRQSNSDAGFVGLVEEERIEVIAAQGYPQPEDGEHSPALHLELPILQRTVQSGNSQAANLIGDNGAGRLDPEAMSQLAVPIRREAEVIGILFLESRTAGQYSEEKLRFLTRLSDHAAIAISNSQYYAEVQEANIAKSDFVSFVSHELKTPMTSIKGYADLLAKGAVGPVSEAQSNFLSTIRSNVNRMSTLVSDLADISRIEAGRLRLEFSAVPIIEVVEEIVRSTQAQFEEKEQVLRLEIPEDLEPVWGDRTRLIQVLTNLVSNAHKYTPAGGTIEIRATQEDNTRDPEGAPQVIHLAVEDTGIGISAEDQKKIFQKFFRSEDEQAREAPGTGLGLNITKNLVEMQGGQIWFESTYGKGTTFHFTIPVVEPA